jgi:hypothetical protein
MGEKQVGGGTGDYCAPIVIFDPIENEMAYQ